LIFSSTGEVKVNRAIIGGAVGSIPLPTRDFDYPLGIRDFEELFGVPFDEEEYRKIHFAYFVGQLEAAEPAWERDVNGNIVERYKSGKLKDTSQVLPPMHDMSYMPRSIPTDMGKQYRAQWGESLDERFKRILKFYNSNGYHVASKIYRHAGHKGFYNSPFCLYIRKHLKEFYEYGIDFPIDFSSAKSIMPPDKARERSKLIGR